jgi:DNA-binding LytR/AlgR family response regulator
MKCIVIEDDIVQQELILNLINETDSLNFIRSYESSISAIKDLSNIDVDIIFLDVEMPGMSGIEFLEQFKLPEQTKVILTTSNKEYAIQAFDNGVTDYLLKPISYPRFLKAVNKVINQSKNTSSSKDFLFIKSNGAQVKLKFDDILWLQSASEYIMIYTTKGKHMVYSSMDSILEKLSNNFVRVHRSNIISLDKIEKIHNNIIEIDGQLIKVSKGYKDNLKVRLEA